VGLTAALSGQWGMWLGCLYSLGFLATAIARSRGYLMETDLTHKAGDLDSNPSVWTVNRTYHWRHHFDSGNAYYCGSLTLVDKLLGTALSLKGKTIAITGASGSMGRALIAVLQSRGARLIALTTREGTTFEGNVRVVTWRSGEEAALRETLANVDILIINHGVNQGDRSAAAVAQALEVNTLSAWRLMELFFETVTKSEHRALKEVWVNTSEAEVNPAFSPLYELSKRAIGDLITLRRLDAPCVVRKLILGPFKSDLNPIGIMSAGWVARAIVALAERDVRNIIVTINPLTYLLFPIKEFSKSLYFRAFAKPDRA
jgi:monoglucosyldiacylglycerol epimerase